jgi:hypothetical protein
LLKLLESIARDIDIASADLIEIKEFLAKINLKHSAHIATWEDEKEIEQKLSLSRKSTKFFRNLRKQLSENEEIENSDNEKVLGNISNHVNSSENHLKDDSAIAISHDTKEIQEGNFTNFFISKKQHKFQITLFAKNLYQI